MVKIPSPDGPPHFELWSNSPGGRPLSNPQWRAATLGVHTIHRKVAGGDPYEDISIYKEIFLIDICTTFKNYFAILFGKCGGSMMHLLIYDILFYDWNLLNGVSECGISFSPPIEPWKVRIVFQPVMSCQFQTADKFRHSDVRRYRYKYVYVVGHAANAVNFCALISRITKDITI